MFPVGQRKLGIVLICAIGLLAASVRAGTVTILNPGFEIPDTAPNPYTTSGASDWVLAGSGGGVWDINTFPLGFWTESAPQGKQVGWLAPAPSSPAASYTQTLGESLLADTIYTLSGYVGHPIGYGESKDPDTQYTVELLAGGTTVQSITGTGLEGKFSLFSLNFNSIGSSFIGQVLGIRLSTNQAQTAFDDISLITASVAPVPLPAAAWMGLSLMALALPVGLKRRFKRAMDI